jgi:hypothetical protein
MVIRKKTGIITRLEDNLGYEVLDEYFAIGSGRTEALGAMYAGADAITAVKAAIHLDTHCDGDIYAVGFTGPERRIPWGRKG